MSPRKKAKAQKRTMFELEREVAALRQQVRDFRSDCGLLEKQASKLEAFKAYVHKRLDRAGVPADPEPAENAKHGCRVEGRFNWLLARIAELEAALREAGSVLALSDPEGRRMRAIQAPEDSEIEALCERVGYGAVMDSAARLWRKKGGNGAHTIGACVGEVIFTLEMLDRALGQKVDRPATETGRIVSLGKAKP